MQISFIHQLRLYFYIAMELFDMFQAALSVCDSRLNFQLTADMSFVGLARI